MANDLNDEVRVVVSDADVVTVPIDDTLSNSGEAADAKAVGDALALKADKSELQAAITVNGQSADAQGHIIVTAAETKMSDVDTTTISEAIAAVDGKTAGDIPVSSEAGAPTIAEALENAQDVTAEDIPMSVGDSTSVAAKIGAMVNVENANSTAIVALQGRTGDDIAVSGEDSTKISEALEGVVKTVNGEGPDGDGNVQVDHTMTADNLTSSASQTTIGEFARRTSGGNASISTGSAWLSVIRGNRTHIGYVPESLNMTVNAAPREEGETPITATIDRDAFVEAVSETSTILTLTYTVSWSEDPAEYGITVSGTPVSGDQITVTYVAESRGTIVQSDPQTFVSTGWNLYNHDVGYAIGLKYAPSAQFRISGTYSAVKFSSTLSGEKTTITPQDGLFTIQANGYIWVEGGNDTDTEVFMTWDDWVLPEDAPEEFEPYTSDEIVLADLMEDHFPYGLLRVADVRDEIDFNTGIATSRVQRLSYSAENLATAKASGLAYEYDTNYIYLERAAVVEYDLDDYEISGMYAVNDHGLELFSGTDIAVYTVIVYGNNLKNKLERDVLTISQQTLTSAQQDQVMENIGAKQAIANLSEKVEQLDDSVVVNLANTSTYADVQGFTGNVMSQYRYLVLYGYIPSGQYIGNISMVPIPVVINSPGYEFRAYLTDGPIYAAIRYANGQLQYKVEGASIASVHIGLHEKK